MISVPACSVANVLGVLDLIKASPRYFFIDSGSFVRYFNPDAIYQDCIKTDKHFEQFLSQPELIRDAAPLASSPGFDEILLRCESIEEVERFFELVRLAVKASDQQYCFALLVEVLEANPIDRIYSLAPALRFWQAQDGIGFAEKCPDAWKYAIDGYSRGKW